MSPFPPCTRADLQDSSAIIPAVKRKRWVGIWFAKDHDNWAANVVVNSVRYRVAGFPTAAEAAAGRDRLLLGARGSGPLNFPKRPLKPATPAELRMELRREGRLRRANPF